MHSRRKTLASNAGSGSGSTHDIPREFLSSSHPFSSFESQRRKEDSMDHRTMSDSYLSKSSVGMRASRHHEFLHQPHPPPTPPPRPPSTQSSRPSRIPQSYGATVFTQQLDIFNSPVQSDDDGFFGNVSPLKSSSLSRYMPLPAIRPKSSTPIPRDVHIPTISSGEPGCVKPPSYCDTTDKQQSLKCDYTDKERTLKRDYTDKQQSLKRGTTDKQQSLKCDYTDKPQSLKRDYTDKQQSLKRGTTDKQQTLKRGTTDKQQLLKHGTTATRVNVRNHNCEGGPQLYRNEDIDFETVPDEPVGFGGLPLNLHLDETGKSGLSTSSSASQLISKLESLNCDTTPISTVASVQRTKQTILLAVKLPNSQRIQKCFHPEETCRAVRRFAELESRQNLSDYQLVCNMPRVELGLDTTIQENGLLDKTLLHLERLGFVRHNLQ